ncbi:tail fiber domain-containing protein, partial [Klebsiella pneumoniae]|nr:tail fiber domain-containing protein [Klebsiella pneumoniae]
TLTDPITGKQVTVPAIAGMAKASDLNALAKLTGGNKLDGSQVITSDNAGFILGKNSDLALLKKQGQGGTIAVGSGTPFRVQRSRATTVSPSETYDDILVIGTNNQTTLPGDLVVGGGFDNTAKGKLYSQALELSMGTPYIDFHHNKSANDYTARLITTSADQLSVQGSHLRVDRDLRVGQAADIGSWIQCRYDCVSQRSDFGSPAIGSLVSGGRVRSRISGRGGNGDTSGAWGGFYLEEYVGTEHRIVLYMDGFGRTDAWTFRSGGAVSTPKGDVMTTGSDVRLKEGFTEAPQNALQRVGRLGVCEYQMKGENRRRRGFIAQQADTVDTTYTFMGCEQEIDGEKFQVMNVDYVAIIADLVSSVQELRKQLSDLMEMNKQINCHSTGALNQ